MVLFGFAMSWVFATVGLAVGDPETAQAAAFPVLAPLVFASTAFVPATSMPGWLQVFANHQPVSANANAARALTLGGPTAEYVVQALAWDIGSARGVRDHLGPALPQGGLSTASAEAAGSSAEACA